MKRLNQFFINESDARECGISLENEGCTVVTCFPWLDAELECRGVERILGWNVYYYPAVKDETDVLIDHYNNQVCKKINFRW